MKETSKTCRFCKIEKPLEEFPKNKSCRLGRESTCRQCRKSRRSKDVIDRMLRRKRIYGKKQYEDLKKAGLPNSSQKWRARHPSKATLKSRELGRSEKGRKYQDKYRETREESASSKIKHLQQIEQWRIKNKKRMLAHAAVYNLIAREGMVKPIVCPKCGNDTDSRRMYLRLNKDLDVKNPMWLCSKCTADGNIEDDTLIKKRGITSA